MEQLLTSPDGQWIAHRRGRDVALVPGAGGAPVGRVQLPSDDIDLALVGPPAVLVAVVREPDANRVLLYQPPYLDAVARLDLETPMRLVAVTGPRLVLVSPDSTKVTIVRAAGRALAAQPLDPGGPVETASGLDRNQVLLVLAKKLEVWDAVSSRPLLRLQLQLPPAPRSVGAAQGHLWATRPGSDEVFVYRLSDGRPFRHYVGAAVREVVCHPASPLLVIETPRGLVRLHCFAHSLHVVDAPWVAPTGGAEASPLAQLVLGEDVSLVGVDPEAEVGAEPWRVAIAGAHAPAAPAEGDALADGSGGGEAPLTTAADKLRAMRGEQASSSAFAPAPAAPSREAEIGMGLGLGGGLGRSAAPSGARSKAWREAVAAYGAELARGVESELPIIAVDTELGELAHRLGLSGPARRALAALYALHLVGEPELAIARLARAMGEWTEALGQGDLVAHALVRRRHGRLALRGAVTDMFDGAPPRAIRIVGGASVAPAVGAWQVARAGRGDAAVETALATQLGRIAVIARSPARALLEARLYGATTVALVAPAVSPDPWPRDAALVVVTDATSAAWASALPPLAS